MNASSTRLNATASSMNGQWPLSGERAADASGISAPRPRCVDRGLRIVSPAQISAGRSMTAKLIAPVDVHVVLQHARSGERRGPQALGRQRGDSAGGSFWCVMLTIISLTTWIVGDDAVDERPAAAR